MPADIDISTGRAALMITRQPAWHDLGTIVADAPDSATAITLAGLDWLVEQWPITAHTPDASELVPIDNRVANVRSDTHAVLGVVSTDYQPLQNREAFAFLDSLVAEGELRYETAGAIKGGRQVWMLAQMPRQLRVPGTEDVSETYMLLTNGHDGSRAITVLPTIVRVVCANTLSLALSAADARILRIRHDGSLDLRVADAQKCLGLVTKKLDVYQEHMNLLAGTLVSDAEASAYFRGIFPVQHQPAPDAAILDQVLAGKDNRDQLMQDLLAAHEREQDKLCARNEAILDLVLENYHNEANSLPGIEGTAWAALNSITEWADHQRPVRGKDEAAKVEARAVSAWTGPADAIKQEAFSAALELALGA